MPILCPHICIPAMQSLIIPSTNFSLNTSQHHPHWPAQQLLLLLLLLPLLFSCEVKNTIQLSLTIKNPPFSSSPSLCSVRVAALTEASVGLGREQLTEAPRRLLAPRSVFRCSGGQLDRPRISAAGPISPEH